MSQNVIGNRIRLARECARWSVQDLCDVCNDDVGDDGTPDWVPGIGPTAVKRWEGGTHEPKLSQLRVLAWALSNPTHGRTVTVPWLLGEGAPTLPLSPRPRYTDCPPQTPQFGWTPEIAAAYERAAAEQRMRDESSEQALAL